VYFGRNEYHELKVKNGSVGQVIGFTQGGLTIELDKDGRQVQVDPENYPYLNYGYATTIYKSQGKTVDRTLMLASTHLNRHSTYVALSRHRQDAEIFYSKETFLNEACLTDHLSREGQKTNILEHTVPSRTSAWLDQAEHTPDLVLDEILKPTQAALDYLDQSYDAYKEAERNQSLKSIKEYQHDFEVQHPERANALKWEMFDVLSVSDQADLLKERYAELNVNTNAMAIGDKDHPLYEEIQLLVNDHSTVIDYWNTHDRALINQMQGVLDRGNTEPEPKVQEIESEQAVEPEKEAKQDMQKEREREMYHEMDFEMEM